MYAIWHGSIRRLLTTEMLRLALIFLIAAILSALVGFGDVPEAMGAAARTVFLVLLVLFLLSLIRSFQRSH